MQKYSLTEEHRAQMAPWAAKWIANAMSTKPMDVADRAAMRAAVRGLYEAAGLKPPPEHRIVFVPSPLVLRLAGGFAAAIWHLRKQGQLVAATRDATYYATRYATNDATRDATFAATRDATYDATRDATDDATRDATDDATRDATYAATRDATNDATYDATFAATRDATYYATNAATRDATYDATNAATDDATRDATYDATFDATFAATRDATFAATRDATYYATDDATRDATDDATYYATRYATNDATRDATFAATRDATYDATYYATNAATNAATYAATRDATNDATRTATYAATRDATNDATRDATFAATRDATYDATRDATDDATRDATDDATRYATNDATRDATDDATRDATYAATRDATRDATYDATDDAENWYRFPDVHVIARSVLGSGLVPLGVSCAAAARRMWQGGNQWSGWSAWLSFFREVVKLGIDYTKWKHWEDAAVHAGPRIMHAEFCMISDRPRVLTVDDQNRPHNAVGPFCAWSDGTGLYSWHGVRVPCKYYLRAYSAREILAEPNAEVRRALIERYEELNGKGHFFLDCNAKVIDTAIQPMRPGEPDTLNELMVIDLPDDPDGRMVGVRVTDPSTSRQYVLRVHPELRPMLEDQKFGKPQQMTVRNALASTFGMSGSEYILAAES